MGGKRIVPEECIGKRYGRLTIKSVSNRIVWGTATWVALCDCDCGNQHEATVSKLRYGHVKSCGCLRADAMSEFNTKHGGCHTRLHSIWTSMKQRCLNPNARNYHNYGGRGITICEEWVDSFETFRGWALNNGYADDLSIDRRNNDDGYRPGNCRWVDRIMQNQNRRVNTSSGTGIRGVQKHRNKWMAGITCNKNTLFLGSFDTIEEATEARRLAEKKYWNKD